MAKTITRRTTVQVAADLDKHEAVCAERWRETIYRIKRLEVLILTTLFSLVVGMATILSGQVFYNDLDNNNNNRMDNCSGFGHFCNCSLHYQYKRRHFCRESTESHRLFGPKS